jgi:dTDP-4-amino-4,6-dideoxygalactose transaminase
VFHLYVVRVADRDAVQKELGARGISTAIHYPISLPSLEAYNHLGHRPEDFPVANAQMGEILSLPMYPELSDEMIGYTADALKQIVRSAASIQEIR